VGRATRWPIHVAAVSAAEIDQPSILIALGLIYKRAGAKNSFVAQHHLVGFGAAQGKDPRMDVRSPLVASSQAGQLSDVNHAQV